MDSDRKVTIDLSRKEVKYQTYQGKRDPTGHLPNGKTDYNFKFTRFLMSPGLTYWTHRTGCRFGSLSLYGTKSSREINKK